MAIGEIVITYYDFEEWTADIEIIPINTFDECAEMRDLQPGETHTITYKNAYREDEEIFRRF